MPHIADHQRPCPLCNGEHNSLIRPLRFALFDDIGSSGESPLVSCLNCGFVYNDFNAGPYLLQKYYRINDHYLNSTTSGTGGDSPIEQSRYQRLQQLLAPSLRHDCSIVDIGCGKAGFLKHLSTQGYRNLHGIEASDSCRDHIQATSSIAVYAKIAELQSGLQPDCVVLSHVLEHIYNPYEFLEEIVNTASPGALIYIEVPNTTALLNSAYPWLGFYFEHINHFDINHLLMMTRKAGLQIITQSTWSFSPEGENPQECCYVLCSKSAVGSAIKPNRDNRLAESINTDLSSGPLSPSQLAKIEESNHPLALWGISQYAMLIMGMYPAILNRSIALFDASPAKIGRRIQNIVINHPENLVALTTDCKLLLPHSGYTAAMIDAMAGYGYAGEYELI